MHTKGVIDIKRRIIDVVAKEAEPMSMVEIAKKSDISWSTAKTNVLELLQENKLNVKKYGKNWIIWKKNKIEEGERTCSVYRRF